MTTRYHERENDTRRSTNSLTNEQGAPGGQAHGPECRVYAEGVGDDEARVAPLVRALHGELCRPGAYGRHLGGRGVPACVRAAAVAAQVLTAQLSDVEELLTEVAELAAQRRAEGGAANEQASPPNPVR